ncbi:48ffdf09-aa56-4320-b0f3-6ed4e002712f [Thermothielavioides terrestris]|uniref:48ffdf09-aa56-4320-b0f3-6ed4e002712f n=1 Tax=Thermothielavioides terrestris TaxID=2587410 RepID=A0A3S4F6R0_9PEZI|nr:48ffdf09-aa56-4320-b0f3-6ed4e002712f [Thermothielavioides terrestris]
MASSALPPMYTDTPLAPIPTPKFETGKVTTAGADGSSPRVGPADKADFVGYCLAWVDCVATHHHYEETELFPNIDKAAGQTGLMDSAVHEHEAFQGGLERFRKYLQDEGAGFSGAKLVSIMDEFKEPLYSHLKSEPPAIVALARYSTKDKPIDILGIADAAGKSPRKKQVTLKFMLNTLPVFFLNMETVEFEGGMWHGVFPPLKGLARTVMNQAIPMLHSGRWRFASCSADGRAKRLAV